MKNRIWCYIGILVATGAALMPFASHAQVWANGPNGIGYTNTPNPISPNCTPPDVWTAYNGHYMCAPPPPECQYGYASSPVVNGNGTWSYSCNGPPAPPPPGGGDPVQNANVNCVTAIQQAGYSPTSGPASTTCGGMACLIYYAQGPVSQPYDQCGDVSTSYDAYCWLNPNNTVNQINTLLLGGNVGSCSTH